MIVSAFSFPNFYLLQVSQKCGVSCENGLARLVKYARLLVVGIITT